MKKNWFIIIIVIFFLVFEVISSIFNNNDNGKKQVVFMNDFCVISDKLEEYKQEFESLYPDIEIKNECIGDNYETICSYRLNAGNAGDVMVVPSSMNISYYKDYYEPLGTLDELSKKYRFAGVKAVNNTVYSIPTDISISGGIMYNMDVLKKAGIYKVPQNYDEFINTMRSIKNNTNIVSLYLNSNESEQLKAWNSLVYTESGNANYNEQFALSDSLFQENNSYYKLYKVLYECINEKLVEENYLTSKWEEGMFLFKNGEVAAVVTDYDEYLEIKNQCANKDSIIYAPFFNGKNNKYLYADVLNELAINVESSHKKEARIWLDFLINDTDFLNQAGDLGILCRNENLDSVKKVESKGMEIIYSDEKNEEILGIFEKHDNNSALGMTNGTFVADLINKAADESKSYDDFCSEWNEEWKKSNVS
ncbi:MAG: extracellular solute-binding protein [Clostridium butyricum]|nr:extracellular solute-binding protein [Clostridium butyricum]